MAESPRGLAARWAARGLGMADELTGEPSAAREEAECMSEMASDAWSDDAHDELMCSMDVIAEVHAQDAEREQQREGVSVGCVIPDGDGAGGDGGEAGRAFEGDDGGGMGCEGVDGAEQEASMAAREAEGGDEDEDMAGDENFSMQEAEGGGGATRGVKKKKKLKRCKQKGRGLRQRLAMASADLRPAADEASVN